MADQVTPPSGMLHSDTLVPGLTPKVGDVTSNFQALYTSLEDYATTINALVSEASTNTANIDAEETARAAADTALQADVDALDVRVSSLEGSADGGVSYGSGDVTLDEDDMAYRVIRKNSGGTVTVPAPSLLGPPEVGQVLTITNEAYLPSAAKVTVSVTQTGAADPVLFQLASGEAVVLRYNAAIWQFESTPSSPAYIGVTATSDRADDLYKFQNIHYTRTTSTASQTITLPERDSFFTGQRVTFTVAGTADTDLSAASGDAIVDSTGSDTKVTVSGGQTVELVATEAGTWHVVSKST